MADNDKDNVNTKTNATQDDLKPCFEISDEKIFLNLHQAACEKAAKVLGVNYDSSSIGLTIINTAVSKDGNSLDGAVEFKKNAGVLGFFKNPKNVYEVGVVIEVEDLHSTDLESLTTTKDILQKIYDDNEEVLYEIRRRSLSTLKEYFEWFAGNHNLKENDLEAFIPDYEGNSLRLNGYKIRGMEDKDLLKYFKERHSGGQKKPRIGYKVDYSIDYGNKE